MQNDDLEPFTSGFFWKLRGLGMSIEVANLILVSLWYSIDFCLVVGYIASLSMFFCFSRGQKETRKDLKEAAPGKLIFSAASLLKKTNTRQALCGVFVEFTINGLNRI